MKNIFIKIVFFVCLSFTHYLFAQESNTTNIRDSVSNSSNILKQEKLDSLKNISNNQINDNVTIIVNSFGKTVDEALRQSLRNALEQVYGLFISSKTNVINDKLIIDKIVSVSVINKA